MVQSATVGKNKEGPDARELEILWHIYKTPQIKDLEIANDLGIGDHNVEYARKNMIQKGWIKNSPRVDLSRLGFPERYRVDIWVDMRQIKEAADKAVEHNRAEAKKTEKDRKEIQKVVRTQRELARYIVKDLATLKPYDRTILIEDILILLGGAADLTAIVRAINNEAMLEFVTEGLRMCPGVGNTSTSLEKLSYLNGTL
jgi:hypothetical protein